MQSEERLHITVNFKRKAAAQYNADGNDLVTDFLDAFNEVHDDLVVLRRNKRMCELEVESKRGIKVMRVDVMCAIQIICEVECYSEAADIEIIQAALCETDTVCCAESDDDNDDDDENSFFSDDDDEESKTWLYWLVLNDRFVLSHRGDDILPIEKFIFQFALNFHHVKIESKTIMKCRLRIACSDKEHIESAAQTVLERIGANNAVESQFIKQVENEKSNAICDDEPIDEEDKKNVPRSLEEIDALIGAGEFKQLAHELCDVAPQIKKHKTADVFMRRAYMFSVGDGCGLSTQLELLAHLFSELKLFDCSSTINECSPDLELSEMLEQAEYKTPGRILCFDLSKYMDKGTTPEFRTFLRGLSAQSTRQLYVFRIPFVDAQTRNMVHAALSDVFTLREVAEAPGTLEEHRAYAEKLLREKGFTLSEQAWRALDQRIIDEKNDGHFYGFMTVSKVVDELLYEKHLAFATGKSGTEETVIYPESIPTTARSAMNMRPALEQLDEMIGVGGMKERILEIMAQIEVANASDGQLQPCLHMRFIGNPGTGKTTVARIMGQLMKERGILSRGRFFEYEGRDFCGQYIGETAPKTAAMCRDAYGSVLFIDEAYSLYRGDKGNRDYGREAIDTLVAQMENHRRDFVVIMAGYPDDMETLMAGNAGLSSRMPYVIEFPNYDKKELFEIFMSMARKLFSCEDVLETAVRSYFDGLSDSVIKSPEFANARFVRNLFERTWGKASVRRQLESDKPFVLRACDFDKASADREFSELQKKKSERIGFKDR